MQTTPTLRAKIKEFISTHPFFIQMISGASVVAFAFACVLKISEDILEKDVLSFDTSIVSVVYGLRGPAFTTFMMVITAIGSPLTFFFLSILVAYYFYRKSKKEAILFSFIFLSACGLNTLLKIFFARPRPTLMPLVLEKSYSFPSGHAMNSLVFYMMLSYFVYRNTKNVKVTAIVAVFSTIIVGLIGFSRVYLGAHYPSDVIAGYATGILWSTSIIMIEKYIHARRKKTAK